MLGFDRILYLYDFIRPFLDIAVMTIILYKAYDFISKTNGGQMLKSLLIVVIVYGLAVLLKLQTILWLMNIIAPALVIGFALIFQPEIRKLFIRIGQNGWFAFGTRSRHTYVDAVLIAAEMLSQQKRGMLAVFMRHTYNDPQFLEGRQPLSRRYWKAKSSGFFYSVLPKSIESRICHHLSFLLNVKTAWHIKPNTREKQPPPNSDAPHPEPDIVIKPPTKKIPMPRNIPTP